MTHQTLLIVDDDQARPNPSQWERSSQVMLYAILGTLAGLVETREPEASQHIPRTRRQIAIPERILLKPGRLDATEFEVVKTHSRLGGEILTRAMRQAEAGLADCPAEERQAALAYLDLARTIATSHHERWDGTGYPEGLKAEDIPLPARLMALADVFDAFTTRRVYKPALGLAVTRDYILSQGGKQFDPQVVAAFTDCFDEFVRIARECPDPRPA